MDWFMHHAVLVGARLRRRGRGVRRLPDGLAAPPALGQRADARNRAGDPGRRGRVPPPPVHDDRRGGARAVPADRLLQQARLGNGDRLPDRRRPLRGRRLHRHERRRALERPHRGGGPEGPRPGAERRVPRGLGHGHARRRSRPLRRRRLLRRADRLVQPLPEHRDPRPDRPRLRRLADLGLRPARRRYLHEGCRRRRRPGREDRGGHPRGRPAQPGRDRGQRRRQRRRLRRHGRRPVRDLRGHVGRRDAAWPHRRAR